MVPQQEKLEYLALQQQVALAAHCSAPCVVESIRRRPSCCRAPLSTRESCLQQCDWHKMKQMHLD